MSSSDRPQPDYTRREFLESSTRNAACMTAGVFSLRDASNANEKLQVGIIGVGAHGQELAAHLASMKHVHVSAICDVDARHLAVAQQALASLQGHAPIAMSRHEQLLDRPDVDAVVVATPDHWHCQHAVDVLRSKRHLFLETPIAHSIAEGELICRAAARAACIVQVGLPQRSGAHFESAVKLVRSGGLGTIHLARAWAVHQRKSIGVCSPSRVPVGLDYPRWLGSAEKRPYQENRLHKNWYWAWDYGSGELGHWGTHNLDIALWGLNLDFPRRVSAVGGVRAFQDDRETPDTLTVTYEYPDLDLVWEHRQWGKGGIEGRTSGTAFYGELGTLVIDRSGWKVYGHHQDRYADASEIKTTQLQQFVDAIQTGQAPPASLEAGRKVSALCHLGNISYRLGRDVRFDSVTMSFGTDEQANQCLMTGPTHQPSTEIACQRGTS